MGFKNKTEGKKDGRKQKGQKAAEQNQRIKKYKKEQQVKKKGKKPTKYQNKTNQFGIMVDKITIKITINYKNYIIILNSCMS